MKNLAPNSEKARKLLRGYLLGTLSDSEHAQVEDCIKSSVEWRDALEAEREALSIFDHLPDIEPKRDLTSATMARIAGAKHPRIRRDGRLKRLVLGYGLILLIVCSIGYILLPSLARSREAARRSSTANNLKQWGIIFKMYANDNEGELWPPVTRFENLWVPDLERLWPEYLSDYSIMVAADIPDSGKLLKQLDKLFAEESVDWETVTRIASKSFTYTGWNMQNDTEAANLVKQRTQIAKADINKDLNYSEGTIYRLREGIERFLITDINNPAASNMIQSEVPIMFENVYEKRRRYRAGKGTMYTCLVLYMDGHVSYVKHGSFPLTDSFADTFGPQQE